MTTKLLRSCLLAAGVFSSILAATACRDDARARVPVAAEPAAPPSASASAPVAATPTPPPEPAVVASAAEDTRPASWLDPRVLAELTTDCSYVPLAPEPSGAEVDPDSFRCKLGYEQACDIEPCLFLRDGCEEGCESTCNGCGDACVARCTACNAKCKDDACHAACATKCATCREACTQTLQRCGSAICGAKHERESSACMAKLKSDWKRQGCPDRCRKYAACSKHCDSAGQPTCQSCRDAVDPKFTACMNRCKDRPECEQHCHSDLVCFPAYCESLGVDGPS